MLAFESNVFRYYKVRTLKGFNRIKPGEVIFAMNYPNKKVHLFNIAVVSGEKQVLLTDDAKLGIDYELVIDEEIDDSNSDCERIDRVDA